MRTGQSFGKPLAQNTYICPERFDVEMTWDWNEKVSQLSRCTQGTQVSCTYLNSQDAQRKEFYQVVVSAFTRCIYQDDGWAIHILDINFCGGQLCWEQQNFPSTLVIRQNSAQNGSGIATRKSSFDFRSFLKEVSPRFSYGFIKSGFH